MAVGAEIRDRLAKEALLVGCVRGVADRAPSGRRRLVLESPGEQLLVVALPANRGRRLPQEGGLERLVRMMAVQALSVLDGHVDDLALGERLVVASEAQFGRGIGFVPAGGVVAARALVLAERGVDGSALTDGGRGRGSSGRPADERGPNASGLG